MQKKINLLHVIRPAEGGMKKHLQYLIKNTDSQRYNIMVACSPDGTIYRELKSEGIKIYPLNVTGDINPFFDLKAAGLLTRIIKKQKITIMHVHSIKAALVGRIAAICSGVPGIFFTVHNSFFYEGLPGWQKWLAARTEILLSKYTDVIITVSEALKKEIIGLKGIDPNRVVTINNGIEIDCFASFYCKEEYKRKLGLASGIPVIGTVARLAPQKGIIYLLRAARLLKDVILPGHPFQLVIVGDGPLRKPLEDETRLLGLHNYVDFKGARNDVPEYYNAFDIFVLPSETEGLPLVLLEALASGLPVVASNVGGIPEVIKDGYNGLLVQPCCPQEIAASIARIIRDPVWGAAMGERGRVHIKSNYNAHSMACRVSELYEQVLNSKNCFE